MTTDHNHPTDHGWEHRRLILASLAPRTTTRPARHSQPQPDDPATDNPAPKPGLLTRSVHASTRAALATGRQFNKRVPPDRRTHTAVITAAAIVLLLVALSAINYITTDVNPPPNTTAATAAPPPPTTQTPLRRDTILNGVTATDLCPRDANYADANRAFDGDFATAWICTRANNKDGQTIQVNFGRQVTLTQIRVIGGFDATAPDGTDQWPKHRIVTELEAWFPKDLKRDPATIDTGGARDWRYITLNPPATVSKLLIRIKTTSEPPQPPTPTSQTAAATPDEVTTVAISEIQFIGTEAAPAPGT